MIRYQYQIIRYVHDQFTGEFVNVGLVLYAPRMLFLKARVTDAFSRVTGMFPEANEVFIRSTLQEFANRIDEYSFELRQIEKSVDDLAFITEAILPKDESALLLTEVKSAIDSDVEIAFDDLFMQMVTKYIRQEASFAQLDINDN